MKKNKLNKIIMLILLLIVGISGVTAATVFLASDVKYDNSVNNIKSNNVQGAIDEIYEKLTNDSSCIEVVEPVLGEGLIPVTVANNGTVTYADTSKQWYNYCNKEWANAVILVSNPSKSYVVGNKIEDTDIESYFVWIPKYKYKLWNTGVANKKLHSIDIVFDKNNTTDTTESCVTPMTSGATDSCANGKYMTHPAFISLGVDGFWVGKFETGYKGATTTAAAQVNANDPTKIIVKPNVYSWRNNTVMNMFLSAYNYKRNLDSHMMKNTEWGAVAYLSHSKYGIDKEININNNSSFKTGYSAMPTTSQGTFPGSSGDGSSFNQAYDTEVGYLASTTGNITGIYGMSGGAYEYMASYISGNLKDSGFNETTIATYDAKYFDVYNTASNWNTYQYRTLGDATGEMGPFWTYKDGDGVERYHNNWYVDQSIFVDASRPWFHRGGLCSHGSIAGTFALDRYTGNATSTLGSRLVLTGSSRLV